MKKNKLATIKQETNINICNICGNIIKRPKHISNFKWSIFQKLKTCVKCAKDPKNSAKTMIKNYFPSFTKKTILDEAEKHKPELNKGLTGKNRKKVEKKLKKLGLEETEIKQGLEKFDNIRIK
jgi:hypothetical protein